ncbi:MAG: hypothetical protein IT370_06365 [Deltaproteobacteria bacterium]|nr:hypothetical protein [Deltaproteobacteria bacterium]
MKTVVGAIVLSVLLGAGLIWKLRPHRATTTDSAGAPGASGAPAGGALRQVTLEVLGMT